MSEKKTELADVADAPRSPRFLVRHFGLNRADRRKQARIARLGNPGLPNVKLAKLLLKSSPSNHPVRKFSVDGRLAYAAEPHYFESLAEFKQAFESHKILVRAGTMTSEEAFKRASLAFVNKMRELLTPKAPEPAAA